jgi:uncharacterized protein YjdB
MRTLALGVAVGVVLAACKEAAAPENALPIDCTVGSLSVSPTSPTLHVGDTLRLVAKDTPCPAGPSTATFRWQSSDTAVAVVDSIGGLVLARSTGVATILATETQNRAVSSAAVLQVIP